MLHRSHVVYVAGKSICLVSKIHRSIFSSIRSFNERQLVTRTSFNFARYSLLILEIEGLLRGLARTTNRANRVETSGSSSSSSFSSSFVFQISATFKLLIVAAVRQLGSFYIYKTNKTLANIIRLFDQKIHSLQAIMN